MIAFKIFLLSLIIFSFTALSLLFILLIFREYFNSAILVSIFNSGIFSATLFFNIFSYILIMLLQLSWLFPFVPLHLAPPTPSSNPPPLFTSMGRAHKTFGYSISYTVLLHPHGYSVTTCRGPILQCPPELRVEWDYPDMICLGRKGWLISEEKSTFFLGLLLSLARIGTHIKEWRYGLQITFLGPEGPFEPESGRQSDANWPWNLGKQTHFVLGP